MLGRLELNKKFRSLEPRSFPGDVVFGKRTVIYGHNGSGKSSLAEMLHQLGSSRLPGHLTWIDKNGGKHGPSPDSPFPDAHVTTYCKSWIEENVSQFLDGDKAAAIVTLGKQAKDAKELEEQLSSELDSLKLSEGQVSADHSKAAESLKRLVQSVQDSIVDVLGTVDPKYYTKNRYNIKVVQDLLVKSLGKRRSPEEQKRDRDLLHTPHMDEVVLDNYPRPDWERLINDVEILLRREVTSDLIAGILGDAALQKWLEEGLRLHEEDGDCKFCTNPVLVDRFRELARHFDDSREQVKTRAEELQDELRTNRALIDDWRKHFPGRDQLYEDFHDQFSDAVAWEDAAIQRINNVFDQLHDHLQQKIDAPERTNIPVTFSPPLDAGGHIKIVCRQHNDRSTGLSASKASAEKNVLADLICNRAKDYSALKQDVEGKKSALTELRDKIEAKSGQLKEVRSQQFSSHYMAKRLTRDLAIVYGRQYLTIEVTADGKHYRCSRLGEVASHLSEGERNTLALAYFLRHLEDEEAVVDRNKRVVVIDDPSSSLDRESVFATHSWLLDSLAGYGQTIILTHDFEMLRLLLNSQSSQINKHLSVVSKAEKADASTEQLAAAQAERLFPKVAFLELHTTQDLAGNRYSSLSTLSPALLKHRSEYHFLFDRVLKGIEEQSDHELLFLLPNAARRLLESFVAYHAPDIPNFADQLKKIAVEGSNSEYRDVYDFCNRYSHGDGRENEVLDATAVYNRIRRCLEMIKSTSPAHYEAMCKAVGREQD